MLGKGNTAEVFDYGDGKVLKLFLSGYPKEYAMLEFKNAIEVFRLGLPVPKPYEMVVSKQRDGIVYEKIEGRILADIFNEDKGDKNIILRDFACLHRKWLNLHSGNVLSYKVFLKTVGKEASDESILTGIDALPDGDYLLHGDFHLENILITPDTSPVVIDFMNVCRGPALYDIARTYFLLSRRDYSTADLYLKEMGTEKEAITPYLKFVPYL